MIHLIWYHLQVPNQEIYFAQLALPASAFPGFLNYTAEASAASKRFPRDEDKKYNDPKVDLNINCLGAHLRVEASARHLPPI